MGRGIPDRFTFNLFKLSCLFVAAFFVLGLQLTKSVLRVHKEKRDVIVEFNHKPRPDARWIYVSGNSPYETQGSLHQLEGDKCPIIHRWRWRNVAPVGNMEVRIVIRDADNNILEQLVKTIILGPPEEP